MYARERIYSPNSVRLVYEDLKVLPEIQELPRSCKQGLYFYYDDDIDWTVGVGEKQALCENFETKTIKRIKN